MFASITFVNIVSYMFNFVLSRWLGVSGYGTLSSITAALLLAAIPAAIFTTVIVKHAAELHAVDDRLRFTMLARKTAQIAIGAGFTAIIAVAALRNVIASYLKIGDAYLILGAGGILSVSLGVTMLRGLLLGKQDYRGFAISTTIEGGLRGLVAIVFVAFGYGLSGAIGGWLVAEVVALAYIVIVLPQARNVAVGGDALRLDWRRIAQTSGAVGVSAAALTILSSVDMILVKHFMTAHVAGLYSAVTLCGKVLTFGLSFLPAILLPKVTARAMRGQSVLPILAAAGGVSLASAAAIMAVVSWSPTFALDILVGPAYREAAPLVLPYCVAVALLSLTGLVTTYKTALHQFDFLLPLTLLALAEVAVINALHGSLHDVVITVLIANLIALAVSCRRLTPMRSTQKSAAPRAAPLVSILELPKSPAESSGSHRPIAAGQRANADVASPLATHGTHLADKDA